MLRAESIKESITIQGDINFNDIFAIFVRDSDLISLDDFRNGLMQLNYFATYDEIRVLFKHFDIDEDNHLSKEEFMIMIVPILDSYINMFISKLNKRRNDLTEDSMKQIKNLMKIIIENECEVEAEKQALNSKSFFNLDDAFNLIRKNTVIFKEDVIKFIKYCNS